MNEDIEVIVTKIKMASTIYLTDELLLDTECHAVYSEMLKGLLVRLKGYIWGENQEPIYYPVDWWQAVKDRWFPAWLKEQYPVRYTEISIKVLYPELKISMPKEKHSVIIDKYTESRQGYY